MNILMIAIITGFMLIKTPALAENVENVQSKRSVEQIYKQCWIGGVLFGKSSPIGAITSNVIWDFGSTALSSNVSSEGSCVTSEVHTVAFIHNSYDTIVVDSAKGNGKYLQSLAKMSAKTINDIRAIVKSLVDTNDYIVQTQIERVANLYNAIM